jgi:hypothetical protein
MTFSFLLQSHCFLAPKSISSHKPVWQPFSLSICYLSVPLGRSTTYFLSPSFLPCTCEKERKAVCFLAIFELSLFMCSALYICIPPHPRRVRTISHSLLSLSLSSLSFLSLSISLSPSLSLYISLFSLSLSLSIYLSLSLLDTTASAAVSLFFLSCATIYCC